ncbi:MAG: ABC transporter substrate-binding protein [Syntrophobacteraceae bacterium]|nr:ABC transporter substrate-binding protein [Desulfobacteraceae bacterium]
MRFLSKDRFRKPIVCGLFLVHLLCIAGCGGDRQSNGKAAEIPGVSDGEILLGSSCALSGIAAFQGTEYIRGALTCFHDINAQGGVHGRRIRLVTTDDAYSPARCVANTQQLINEDRVFALTCYLGTPTAVKIIPLVQEAHIPIVGLMTGASALREPFKHCIVNIRASYFEETEATVRHLVEDVGLSRFAVFYQYDAYGFDGLTGAGLALKRYGLEPVARASYTRGTMDVSEAAEQIAASSAQAVIVVGTYGPAAKFIQLVKQRKADLIFHAVSFVGPEELAEKLGSDAEDVIITQVVPSPWETELLPAAARYNRLLVKYFPGRKPSFAGFEGFINAVLLVEGLKRAGHDLSRERLIEAIESIRQFDVGIAQPLDYGPKDHQGLKQVYFTRVKDGRFVPIDDWQQIRRERPVPAVPNAAGGKTQ